MGALVAIAVVTTGLGAAGAAAQAAPPDPGKAKIRQDLMSTLEAKKDADFWIHFSAKADLSAASKISDWNARGTAVAKALRDTAAASQANVKSELDHQGVKYSTYWATNAIRVSGGSLNLAQSLAAHAEVEGLYSPVAYKEPEIVKGTAEHTVNAVEWGIANIKADQVWSQFGVKGAGIVVASIDTGVQFDHPALVNQYRGNNGDGTFNHNYNWFDAAGTCGPAPCDTNGHGTHTMGTMAGSDGANQIGVAPEVKWITANGCCPSDQALISSGQWMLEPTDLNGQNPDASKRPNIINNSWGSTAPSNDPFMEEITAAWNASGIFGMFANGNSGTLGCNSSGSPGSRIINYSAGNYDINNNINSGSGRGFGQDGEIKPNISAPGTNVRSSVPGNGYANFTGTSMASPHVAGTVALLWSASAALRGDVAATRALLDNTAVDKADSQCGGTADDNNVYGEGRLDALALLNAAPIGDTGTLTGKVTKSSDGSPIAGASLSITGAANRQLSTGPDGSYSVLLPTGDYQISVSAFGYATQTGTATVTKDTTTTKNFPLVASPTVKVSGTVSDGGGHGWPLYAKVSVEGPGGVFDYTTPASGAYSFDLPAGATYTIKTEAQYPGYQVVSDQVAVGSGDVTHNVSVPVDTTTCTTAPGYHFGSDGTYQTFDGTSVPSGWSVVDNLGNGQVWTFDDPGNRNNLTGGTGGFAMIDSDNYGSSGRQDSSLVSPVVNLSAVSAPVIRFNQDHNQLADTADVDLSIDGGATWTNVARQTADFRGPRTTEIPIPQAAGQSAVQVRFHYYNATWEWWWEVDNVLIGSHVTCDPSPGGLVVGNVKDGNTGGGINGATVVSGDRPTERATSAATPDDAGLGDGFYWMFSSLTGQHPFTASAANYVTHTQTVDVAADGATQADHVLPAGQIQVEPTDVSATVAMPNGTATRTFTVTNNGSAPVDLQFSERKGDFVMQRADGSQLSQQQLFKATGAPVQRINAPTSFAAALTGKPDKLSPQDGPSADPWLNLPNYPENTMDNRVVNVGGKVYSIGGSNGSASTGRSYVYDPIAQTWTPIAPLPAARNALAVGVIDDQIVVTGGWGPSGPDAGTWAYDPAGDSWTAKASNPAPRSAAGQAVVDGKLYSIGGCTTSSCTPMSNSVTRYDPSSNTWETLPNYPQSVAFPSCGAVNGVVYCTGGNNGTAAVKNSYAFDPSAGQWSPIADAPVDSWASSFAVANGKLLVVGGVQGGSITNAGFAYNPDSGSWESLPNANTARYRGGAACGFYKIGGSIGSFTAAAESEVLPGLEECAEGPADVSWLSIDKTSATLAPGEKVTVGVTMTANVDQPGTYTAGVGIKENTPYNVAPVGVSMTATPPPNWGKLSGTVTGTSCQNQTAPIAGATVQLSAKAFGLSLSTDPDGHYAYWLDRRNNPLTVVAAKDGWQPQSRKTQVSSTPKVENFNLKPVRC